MDRPVVNILGLCAGVGMLDVGVAAALEWLGYRPHAAAMCEWEAYAASVLLARMEDSSMEPCPVWCGDLRDFDGKPFRGVVDVVAAGLPCQPYSVAGKKLGLSDRRSYGDDGNGPIPNFLRVVSECRPAVVFCENVPPWVLRGYFRPVGEELSRMGYTIEDPLFITAEAVGASHKRERVFVLAHCQKSRGRRLPDAKGRNEGGHADGRVEDVADSEHGRSANEKSESQLGRGCGEVGDSDGARREASGSGRAFDSRREPESRRSEVGDAGGEGLSRRRRNEIAVRTEHSEPFSSMLGLFAPGPKADWQGVPEWLHPAIKSSLRLLADRDSVVLDANRTEQIRCGGNGVVPLQAAVAFVHLFRRAMKRTN